MPKGTSGRIVIEIEPEIKDELYTALNKEGLNMKQWFLENALEFLKNRQQLTLAFDAPKENTQERAAS